MICTESEAKAKWCPQARVMCDEETLVPINRVCGEGGPDRDSMCLGSACMLWVWVDLPANLAYVLLSDPEHDAKVEAHLSVGDRVVDAVDRFTVIERRPDAVYGTCGLIGLSQRGQP